MTLQATSLGLMTHQMGGFDAQALSKAFAIPEKKRKPTTENFFMGSWGQGINIDLD
jgi:nitroreductase